MITILTPTYNRAHTLPRLYQSLVGQTSYEFEWLVIDDGSTDETEQLITNYQVSCPFNIRYYKKENGGKHTALNLGFKKSEREWIFIVDSDDWLQQDCTEFILKNISTMELDIDSFSFLKRYETGEIIGDSYDKVFSNFLIREEKRVKGDKAEVFRKTRLQYFSFPEFDGEKFMAESPLFLWYGSKWNTRFFNYPGYICKYLEDGLSHNSVKNRHLCFNSTLYVYEYEYKNFKTHKRKMRSAINWWRFRFFKGRIERSFIAPFCYIPFGAALFMKDGLTNKKIIKNLKK